MLGNPLVRFCEGRGGNRTLWEHPVYSTGNGFRAVPPIASLHRLRRLVLDYSKISELPAFVGDLRSLRELSLIAAHGKNRPIELPGSLAALKGLRVFMGNNYLKLKDQENLRKRFPKITFSFEDGEYDDDAANEQPATLKKAASKKQ